MTQPPIGDYALIGDTRTAALCSPGGSIDWLCLPRFDSPPVFGRLIDQERGGWFSITPEEVHRTTRRYLEDSAVLETTWHTGTGELLLQEGMVLELSKALLPQALLVRKARCLWGSATLRICYTPRRGLPGRQPVVQHRPGVLICKWGSLAIGLHSDPHVELVPGRETQVVLEAGSTLTFALTLADRSPLVFVDPGAAARRLDASDEWWRRWCEDIQFPGPFREALSRSFVTLRLLTYSPSGAPVAAPTTSLPETLGGRRNWDYRFSWPRDASIGLATFLQVGKDEEAHSFMHWLLHASRLSRPRLEVLYTLDGKPSHAERELRDVSGYRGSLPVRVGNAASEQHQLDVYGWVVDTAYLLDQAGRRLHRETWRVVSGLADFVADHWRRPDAGIWEVRGETAHYVHSKMMGWVALDRASRMARSYRVRPSRLRRWEREREALGRQVGHQGFDPQRNSYVRAYGGEDLDAALLLLPVLEFEEPGSPRVSGTVEAIRRELDFGDGLLYRYPPQSDGLEGKEGAFLACSFWLAQALARLGRIAEAMELFEKLWELSNDVGLFAEEMDSSGRHLGNFPQALTHAALIQAALAISRARSRRA
ncbi:MAG: glycoside hydrolase family 15 protein [Actinomycetota bacterium]|nr:glycoside hydrolase family 15 protein [Actinomycetota bacterium]